MSQHDEYDTSEKEDNSHMISKDDEDDYEDDYDDSE